MHGLCAACLWGAVDDAPAETGEAKAALLRLVAICALLSLGLTYATTAGYLATRIAGAPIMFRGKGVSPSLSSEQVKDLQIALIRQGHLTGEADGKLGAGSRAAVKKAQIKYGLPADSYPTTELLERLRRK